MDDVDEFIKNRQKWMLENARGERTQREWAAKQDGSLFQALRNLLRPGHDAAMATADADQSHRKMQEHADAIYRLNKDKKKQTATDLVLKLQGVMKKK